MNLQRDRQIVVDSCRSAATDLDQALVALGYSDGDVRSTLSDMADWLRQTAETLQERISTAPPYVYRAPYVTPDS